MHKLRFRQIHLDFHTSPLIPKIGTAFNKRQWQKTLQDAHVDSITSFAKCHHGWSYHPTKVGKRHPHLKFDLLRKQMDASHAVDINVPVYISAGFDELAANDHPEWMELSFERKTGGHQKLTDAGFKKLCFHTPYLDYLVKQIEETVTLFPDANGIFLDIIYQGECCCRWCLDYMESEGLDPEKSEDRKTCAHHALDQYFKRSTKACHSKDSSMPVFHNSGHVSRGDSRTRDFSSHLELESLPTGGWGYDHFPVSARYVANLGYDYLGMTGKFHTTWGEFGGFKHPNALRYECASMIANGAKCSIGDQLHPEGQLDKSSYAIIGEAYREVAAKEPWCNNVSSIADVGILSAEEGGACLEATQADTGAVRLMLEGHILFDMIDSSMAFSRYKLLILPDVVTVNATLKAKLDAYLKAGGTLMLSGKSGLRPDGTGSLFPTGCKFLGPTESVPSYILPVPELRPSFVSTPMVMHLPSQRIQATTGRSLGNVYETYFNRNYRHFCSHQHTPNIPKASRYDLGVQAGRILYLAHPVFSAYQGLGSVALKDFVLNAVRHLLGDTCTLRTNLPSQARVVANAQPKQKRTVVHLLYAPITSRGDRIPLHAGQHSAAVGVIDELIPLHQITVDIEPGHTVRKVTLEPQGREIPFTRHGKRIQMTVDSFECHQMVVLQR